MTISQRQDISADDFFGAAAGRDIKAAAVRGAGFAFGGQWVRQAVGFGATLVLARLLTPADFGLVAMVTAVTGMLEMYKDLGLSAATVQAPRLEPGQVNAMFWVNTGITLLVVLLLVAAAPLLAAFYKHPELIGITWAVAAGFLADGLALQPWALMRRVLRFGTLAAIETASIGLAVAVAIAMAFSGSGYWALVAFIVTPRLASAVGVWFCCPWRPRLAFDARGLKPLLAFGWKVAACNAVRAFSIGMDSVFIGRLYGGAPLGLYNRALQIRYTFSGLMDIPLHAVATSTLSRLQTAPDLFHDACRRLLYLFQAALIPFWLLTFLCPDAFIRLVFGPAWEESAHYLRILGFFLLLQPLHILINAVLTSLGRSGLLLGWSVGSAMLLLAGFAIGLAANGITGLAVGSIAAMAIYVLVGLILGAAAEGHGKPWHLAQPAMFPLTAGLASAAAARLAWTAGGRFIPPIVPWIDQWVTAALACGLFGLILLLDLRRRRFLGLSWRLLLARRAS